MWIKFKVLLWKSLQLRKRHWLSTIIEITVPCLLFLLIHHLKLTMSNDASRPIIINQTIPSPISEDNLYSNFIRDSRNYFILYTPQTNETEQIMNIVKTKLNISNDNIGTAINEYEIIKKFEKKFNSSQHDLSLSGFGIVFEETIKSHVLKYKIRSTNKLLQTDSLFPLSETPGPMNSGDQYLHTVFLALQLILDKAFILLGSHNKSGFNIHDYNLEVQSYPYANYLLDSSLNHFFDFYFPLFTVLSFFLMCSNTIKRVVEEKDSDIKELMAIMGLKPWMIWTGWILHNFFVYAISITVITYITCYQTTTGQEKLLNYTNPLLFWIFLIMYMIAGVFFLFCN